MGDFLPKRTAPRRTLRDALAAGQVVAPGAYDALSARVIEQAGFPAVYMTGYGTTATLLGRPDLGLLTQTEMVDNARRMVRAVDVPVIADADTGYGNQLNVVRTIAEYEAAGVAGIHLEDQAMPKKCGHLSGKSLVDTAEMVAKVQAAVAARTDPDLLLIARTDAIAVEGLDAALERAQRYRDAGADLIFVEAPRTVAEVEQVAEALSGTPLLYNWIDGGQSPAVPLERLHALGFRLVLFPLTLLFAATGALQRAAAALHTDAEFDRAAAPTFDEFVTFAGLPEFEQLDTRFAHPDPQHDPT